MYKRNARNVRVIVQHPNVNINRTNREGVTAVDHILHTIHGAREGALLCVRQVLNIDSVNVQRMDVNGRTAMAHIQQVHHQYDGKMNERHLMLALLTHGTGVVMIQFSYSRFHFDEINATFQVRCAFCPFYRCHSSLTFLTFY